MLRLWSHQWHEAKVVVHTSSSRVANVINAGSSRDALEMEIARNIWFVSAVNTFAINVHLRENVTSPENSIVLPDYIVQSVNVFANV